MLTPRITACALGCAIFVSGCSGSDDGAGAAGSGTGGSSGTAGSGGTAGGGGAGGSPGGCAVIVDDADCDKSLLPFVFVHGTFGSGADFANVAALLGSNGYCQDRIVSVEYNSLGDQPGANCQGASPAGCGKIDAVIDAVLAKTGATHVDLAGHSQGTGHCGTYLADATHAAKVAHYVNFSGSPAVGAMPTLSLSSENDLKRTPHHATGSDVTVVTLVDEDHFAVASSLNAFLHVYEFLRGSAPQYQTIQCGPAQVTVEGVTESFADNVPASGSIEIRKIGDAPRATDAAEQTLTPDAQGHFGPIDLARDTLYEFKGVDGSGKVIGYQYLPPFRRSNHLVRLLVPSANPLIAGQSTGKIVRGAGHAATVARWSGGALRQDLGASLTVDGVEVLTTDNAGAAARANAALDGGVVGFFMYDANQNATSDLGLVSSSPFLAFTDVFMDAGAPRFIELNFVGGSEDASAKSALRIPNWPSSDALILVTF